MKKTKRSPLKQWLWAFLIALVLALICRTFVIQSFIVSNSRMDKTLLTGDFIFVEKLSFGGRLPITLISIPFTNIYTSAIQLPYMRMPGTGEIDRNYILVFNYPFFTDQPVDKRELQVKRCIALPGDTIVIKNKVVKVNGLEVKSPESAQYKFRLVTNGSKLNQDFINKYQLNDGGMVSDIGIYDFPLVREMADSLLNDTIIKYVRELKDFEGDNCAGVFPQDRHFTWNKDYFGPLWLPKKDVSINLNMKNLALYRQIIEVHEHNTLEVRDGNIYINGQMAANYTFKSDYYFVMDDNRDFAKDSRNWGFVPASHIVGKACYIWFSVDRNHNAIRWNRIFSVPE